MAGLADTIAVFKAVLEGCRTSLSSGDGAGEPGVRAASYLETLGRAFSGRPQGASVERLGGLLSNFGALTSPQKEAVLDAAVSLLDGLASDSDVGGIAISGGLKPAPGVDVTLPIQYARGVGPKRAELIAKLGIKTVKDALYYFPARYEDRTSFTKIARVNYGRYETVMGEVVSAEVVSTKRRNIRIFELTIKDGTGSLTGVWFNQPYMQKAFKAGDMVVLYGVAKPDAYHGRMAVMDNPDHEVVSGPDDDTIHTGRVVPVYRATAGISARQLRAIMKGLVDGYASGLAEFLPEVFLERYRIPGIAEAIKEAHFPEKETAASALNDRATRAHKRLVFDEFLVLQLGLARMKHVRVEEPGIAMMGDPALTARYIGALPFALTPAQKRVIAEVRADMESARPMNRLVQGDVGCGKTAVALAAIVQAAGSGYQSAFMAPTEILAEQHYMNLAGMLGGLGLNVALLTSSLKKKDKERTMAGIADGSVDVAVGTHSLIQGAVTFARLGLAVTDEQHRFGVMQRAVLKDKGENPDVLVMTATPIPRTLALTVYGDLDISVIDALPPGRTPITTRLFDENNRGEAYRLVKRELTAGRQAYVVYPLVEESERSDLKAATEGAESLGKDVFPGVKVGLLHGRMKPAEKEAVMAEFRGGGIGVLVATTVIEVGVDVPNATVMVIEHAERFGLAQLHQLRGRVGRGAHQSYCVLVSSSFSPASKERLGAMLKSTSGFDIAEEDLRQRGPGEFFGTRQSGLPDLALGNIIRDTKILEAARKEAFGIIEVDPELSSPGHAGLKAELAERWRERLGMVKVG